MNQKALEVTVETILSYYRSEPEKTLLEEHVKNSSFQLRRIILSILVRGLAFTDIGVGRRQVIALYPNAIEKVIERLTEELGIGSQETKTS